MKFALYTLSMLFALFAVLGCAEPSPDGDDAPNSNTNQNNNSDNNDGNDNADDDTIDDEDDVDNTDDETEDDQNDEETEDTDDSTDDLEVIVIDDDDFLEDNVELAAIFVDVGGDLHISIDQEIEVVATVEVDELANDPEAGDYFYLWSITQIESELDPDGQEESSNDTDDADSDTEEEPEDDTFNPQSARHINSNYVQDLDNFGFVISQLFPEVTIGDTFLLEADVLVQLDGLLIGQGEDTLTITIVDEGEEAELPDEDAEEGVNSGSGFEGGGGPSKAEEQVVCDGLPLQDIDDTTLALILSDLPYTLELTACGGTPAYTYSWSPTTDLGLGGLSAETFDKPSVEFNPTGTGTYAITGTITDSLAASIDTVFNITVYNFGPLSIDAGADQVTTTGGAVTLNPTIFGGSCDDGDPQTAECTYLWNPGGLTTKSISPSTASVGATSYTVTVTDSVLGKTASDSVTVVVTSSGSSCSASNYDMGISNADFVGYDSSFSGGQAVVVYSDDVLFFDLGTGAARAGVGLSLPAPGRGLAVDSANSRAFVGSNLSGLFTRSIQVINTISTTPTLGTNISLGDTLATWRGMDIVPSTGKCILAFSGSSDGVVMVDSAGTKVALQNMHHTNSFSQPIDVAVVETTYNTAVVANASAAYVTLVPLSSITYTLDNAAGGGQAQLTQIAIGGTAQGIAGDPVNGRVAVVWNDGSGKGQVQIITLSSNEASSPIELSGTAAEQGIAFDGANNLVYVALGSGGTSVVNLAFNAETKTLSTTSTDAESVSVSGSQKVLTVGAGSYISEQCP